METIWEQSVSDGVILNLPDGFRILSVQEAYGSVMLFILVNPNNLTNLVRIRFTTSYATLTDDFEWYAGTISISGGYRHIFYKVLT